MPISRLLDWYEGHLVMVAEEREAVSRMMPKGV
jgi:hypothetical protein